MLPCAPQPSPDEHSLACEGGLRQQPFDVVGRLVDQFAYRKAQSACSSLRMLPATGVCTRPPSEAAIGIW
jgi:hypothetical protein